MAQILEDFIAITQALNQRDIDYAVCGGWAMAIHGFVRATMDIDLLILTKDLDRTMTVAREKGFDIEGLPLNFDEGKTQIRRISKIDTRSKELITLDLILVTEFLQDVWDERKKVKWNEGEYRVVSVHGMSKMKTSAGRPKDLIDLEYLKNLENGKDG